MPAVARSALPLISATIVVRSVPVIVTDHTLLPSTLNVISPSPLTEGFAEPTANGHDFFQAALPTSTHAPSAFLYQILFTVDTATIA